MSTATCLFSACWLLSIVFFDIHRSRPLTLPKKSPDCLRTLRNAASSFKLTLSPTNPPRCRYHAPPANTMASPEPTASSKLVASSLLSSASSFSTSSEQSHASARSLRDMVMMTICAFGSISTLSLLLPSIHAASSPAVRKVRVRPATLLRYSRRLVSRRRLATAGYMLPWRACLFFTGELLIILHTARAAEDGAICGMSIKVLYAQRNSCSPGPEEKACKSETAGHDAFTRGRKPE
ncbi:hypothetical protein KC343_g58 [Hortaea werneckii]|nr:hypothetical protein KC317_g56 [Hortaea werneckii]KAI7628681.1 hypothetical protein KC346_g60 [Hortaea werneckii]KAI7638494.1 hypothetical protein KC343_g58 [Hortaea werneckii]